MHSPRYPQHRTVKFCRVVNIANSLRCITITAVKQELSYRKQIARQLGTQYVEGIHRPKYYTVTLKSKLRVTQSHWKRNHWTNRIRLTISRII